MKLSTKGRYGVSAVYDLAMHYGEGPIAVRTIANRQGISEHYLEQLMGPLRSAGFVKSIRGAQGGYTLGRSPSDISVGEVIRVMEGEFAPVECLRSDWVEQEGCAKSGCYCITKGVWEKVRDSLTHVLDSISLQDLCDEQLPGFKIIKE
jgi:Rrf2 family protein